jgi:hypothetical protein
MGVAASDAEKLLLRASLLRGGYGRREDAIRGEEVLLLLRHKVRYEEWEEASPHPHPHPHPNPITQVRYEEWEGATSYPDPERDVEVARSMAEAAEAERATLHTLAEARAWAAPAASLRGTTGLRAGGGGSGTMYPCVALGVPPRGRLLSEIVSSEGCGAGAEGMPSPALLDSELGTVREAVLGAMHALAQAWARGLRVAARGAHGPLPSDVLVCDERVLLVRTDFLEERAATAGEGGGEGGWEVVGQEGEVTEAEADLSLELNLEPLVLSPLGEHVRAWWAATAERLRVVGGKCASARHQRVLEQYGALNWLLFGWPREQLGAATLIPLVERGASEPARAVAPGQFQADWEQLQLEIFHRLGPRYLDELRATLEALSRRELKLQEAVARASYCIGAEHEEMRERFHELLLLV